MPVIEFLHAAMTPDALQTLTAPPAFWVPAALLAAILLGDALMSIRPPRFIRECLDGVRLPRDWWWGLIVVKLATTIGLVAGIWLPGLALAAHAGVVVYFVCAAAAHIRARFLGISFRVNCLGMLAFSIITFVIVALG